MNSQMVQMSRQVVLDEARRIHFRPLLAILAGLLLLGVAITEPLSAAAYLVINTNDAGPGSLRDAINSANASIGVNDQIFFAIPGVGVQTITPLSQLPVLTDPAGVMIDGFSQPGSGGAPTPFPPSPGFMLIELDGASAGGAHGLEIKSPSNIIQGLVINNFEFDGIHIEATPFPTTMNIITNNYIGMEPDGITVKGNGRVPSAYWAGVAIVGSLVTPGQAINNNIIANLISANYAEGVSIQSLAGNDVGFNTVHFNYIGTDITGMVDCGNWHNGVYLGEGTHDNIVDQNLISGNDFEGVCIIGYAEDFIRTHSNHVTNNKIGLKSDLTPLANSICGVSIGRYGPVYNGGFADSNMVEHNTIAFNGRNGVTVWEHPSTPINGDQNKISQNSIYQNVLLGIDLGDDGVTPNDLTDPDPGANQQLNFPVILQADYCAGYTLVVGIIDIDTSPLLATVEVFKADLDATSYGEGRTYLGSATPDAAGNWQLAVAFQLTVSDLVTATVTDTNLNTSEFALCVTVAALSGCGDLNGDGSTDSADVLLLANYLAGTTGVGLAADFNYDGVIDGTDLALLLNDVAGNL